MDSLANGESLVALDDYATRRTMLYDAVKSSVQNRFPISNANFTLELGDLSYDKKSDFSVAEQKEAILAGKSLHRSLKGKWQLKTSTGEVLAKTPLRTVMHVPYLTDRGTYIRNGSEYSIANQLRLMPGVFTKWTDDGRVEAHVNVKTGTGHLFKISMDPADTTFEVLIKNRKIKLYPLLNALGVPDSLLEEAWGKEILDKNKKGDIGRAVHSTYQTVGTFKTMGKTASDITDQPPGSVDQAPKLDQAAEVEAIKTAMGKMELDDFATQSTLGKPHSFVGPALFLDATKKMLAISRGESEGDDRDSMAYQRLFSMHDFLAEKIEKDPGNILGKLLWKASNKRNLDWMGTAPLDKHADAMFLSSGMSNLLEMINPLDGHDGAYRVTRMGEGAISSDDAIPMEARGVQPTYLGYIDPIRGPQGMRIGVDMKAADGVRVGRGGLLYREMINAKTGRAEWVDTIRASTSVVGFPEGRLNKEDYAPAMFKGKTIAITPKKDIDFYIKDPSDIFSPITNMVPLVSGIKGMRILMGASYHPVALSLIHREIPLVSSSVRGQDIHTKMGSSVGALNSDMAGKVSKVTKTSITITNGTEEKTYPLYENFPFSRKSYLSQTPAVILGQTVRPGSLLATSNYTDKQGRVALGVNLRLALLPYKGHTFEDGFVISESAAKKLTSEGMSSVKVALDSSHEVGYTEHLSAFPGRFTEAQRKTIAQNGVIKPGTIVREGDPLLLMVRKNPPKIGTMGRRTFSDRSVVWDKEDPGIVTDVTKSKDGWRIQVRSNHPMRLGDKISNRYGGKGVVTAILPDAQMPRDVDGKSFDMIGNSFAVDSRTNPAYIIELALGKVAAKTGTAYSMPSFDKSRGTLLDFAKRELKSAGLTDKESVYLPEFNTTVPSVMTGVGYFHKLQQMSEDKSGGESFSGYTLDKQPVTSGGASKRFGSMEVHAILSQGATDFLKDAKLIKGQENYDYWRDLREGRNPTMPTSNFIKDKFLGLVQAAGVNVERKGGKTHIFGMTNSQAASLTGDREVTSADTFDPKRLQPVPGGLFDEKATGGSDGDKFAFIRLPEPMLNPLMEDSIRRILGTTKEELGDLISGKTPYKGLRGGLALAKRLKDINIDNEIALAKQEASGSSSSKRDAAVKKLRALLAIKKQDIQLVDLMLTRVPVLPPRFRPITVSDDGAMASDANYLYRELIHNKDSFSQAAAILPDEQQVDARRALYHSFKAVVGLGDTENAELHQKNVQGLLSHVFGKGSSKYGMFQRRILGIPVNLSTRAVIINDVTLGMDQVGLPEKRAWELYEPFVMRRMVRAGWPQTQSAKLIAERKPEALKYLQEEVKVRPMVINRAPTLYKWNMTGAWPVLIKDGDPLRLPNIILKGHNADFDGDTLNAHIPVTDEAVKDVVTKMMPSKMLFWSRTHKPAYVPTMDYLHGLYVASSNPTSKPAKEYNTDAEAIAAYKRGELDVNDPVRIKTTSLR